MPMHQLRQAVFRDRDGVRNEAVIRSGKPFAPASLAEVQIPSGKHEALMRLKDRKFLLLVITNQPDVSRGSQKREEVEEINRHLQSQLPLDDIFTCTHLEQV